MVEAWAKEKEAELEKLVTKYKPELIKIAKTFEASLEHEGKGLLVDLLGDLIKIIISGGNDDEPIDGEVMEVNGKVDDWFKIVWAKITKFFTDLGEKIKEAFKDFGIDMKDFGKKVKEAFDKLGVKIKEFFDKAFPADMREKIKQMFKHYGDVIVAEFNKLVEKYRDLIISALLKDGKVIIAEGKKLLIAAIDEGVKLIVDLLKKITGNEVLFDDLDDEANDIKDLWKIIKAMVEAWAKEKEAELEKLVTKYKPELIKIAKTFEASLEHEGKGLLVDLLGDLIKIIISGGNDDEPIDGEVMEVNGKVDDWFKMVWAKITKFFTDLGEKIKEAFKDFGIDMKDFGKKVKEAFDKLGVKIKEFFDKAFPADMREKIKQMFKHYGDVIVAEFNKLVEKYKDLIISALLKDGKVIIAEAKKLLIAAIDEGVKLIVDILKKITG